MKASSDENFQNNMLEQLYDAYEYKMNSVASVETKRLITYTIKNISIDIS